MNTTKFKIVTLALLTVFLYSCSVNKGDNRSFTEVSFSTSDSVKIYGNLYIEDSTSPLILLFHQGGSNSRAEYNPIIPDLLKEGYNILAIDQRMGGQTYGKYNRTIAEFETNPYTYCDAYKDLEATLNYAKNTSRFSGDIIAWGSSYSGSLAIQLGSKNSSSIKGVIAFSPGSGGPMAPCKPDEYLTNMETPVLVVRPKSEAEIESVKDQLRIVNESGHQYYLAENGVHGSSLLVEERVGNDVEENWNIILNFISEITNQDN
ncbi:alpha/beta hydrolase family protein [Gracilimonas sp.]|uniref:alpha/beta hydrolase family protein n=1 Tax=Gracilimonas sp. TaxID=1974203 RepID=UPI003D1378F6